MRLVLDPNTNVPKSACSWWPRGLEPDHGSALSQHLAAQVGYRPLHGTWAHLDTEFALRVVGRALLADALALSDAVCPFAVMPITALKGKMAT